MTVQSPASKECGKEKLWVQKISFVCFTVLPRQVVLRNVNKSDLSWVPLFTLQVCHGVRKGCDGRILL